MPVSTSSYSGSASAPPAFSATSSLVRERALRVVVSPGVPRVGRRAVEVPPVLLDVLAVVALRAGQAEHPLLEDRVDAVPQRQRQAPVLRLVAEPGHPVLVPPVHPGPGVVVREEVPGVAVGAVVLADRSPGPFGEVGTPVAPRLGAAVRVGQPALLGPVVDSVLRISRVRHDGDYFAASCAGVTGTVVGRAGRCRSTASKPARKATTSSG